MPLGTHFYYLSALTVVRGLVSNYRQTQLTIVRSPARASIAGAERSHAVVLGSSFAGLFTASVLADQGWRVTLIEKDVLEADAGGVDSDAVQRRLRGRSNVPQARHLPTLHAGGARAAEEILPGVLDDLSWLRRAASASTSSGEGAAMEAEARRERRRGGVDIARKRNRARPTSVRSVRTPEGRCLERLGHGPWRRPLFASLSASSFHLLLWCAKMKHSLCTIVVAPSVGYIGSSLSESHLSLGID